MKVLNIVGARPNFMKVAPVHAAMLKTGIDARLIHTGQHYDQNMSKVFFDQLGMPKPDENLGVGSGSHAIQTARIMEAFEPVLLRHQPDLVLVAGDVNSTLACALVAVKLHVKVAHLEAGLRSRDMRMPEEINRILTDQISDLLLTPSPDADENLLKEGIPESRIHRVGNAMIDSLFAHREAARRTGTVEKLGLTPKGFVLTTLHRPENVDNRETLSGILGALAELSRDLPVIFPIHPRTRARLSDFGLQSLVDRAPAIRLVEPLGYLEFLALEQNAKLVITDSGGVQEETTALGVPCLTVRTSTERPVTVIEGTNTVVGSDPARILLTARDGLALRGKPGRVPKLWDGKSGARVVQALSPAVGSLGTTGNPRV